MPRHHVTLSPCRGFLIVAVFGLRDEEAARVSIGEVIDLRARSGVDRIFFDARDSRAELTPEYLMGRALACGRRLQTSRVAILAHDAEADYPRIWRKGLEETGHEALVFTSIAVAEAWLLTRADAPQVYVP